MVDLAPMNLRRERAWVWWGVALPCQILMLFLLSPTVTRGGDCGELISASYRLGIAHPSGYPVWCLLGRIFALLPLGEVGWRYNLFSSVCGSLAVGTLAATAQRLIWASGATSPNAAAPGNPAQQTARDAMTRVIVARWSALGAGWLLTGFFYVGTQFIIAEVYALAALMGALLLYFALAWHQDGDWRDACTLALLAGLVPVVHLSGVFYLPWLFFLTVWKRGLRARQFAIAGAFFVCGVLPVLYLPIRSATLPAPPPTPIDKSYFWPLDWSHPASLQGFSQHITAAQFRHLLVTTETQTVNGRAVTRRHLTQSPTKLPGRLREFGFFVVLQYLWATPLLFVGAVRAFSDRRVGWVLLLVFASNLATEINFDVSDQSNFFFPAYLVMALWMGLGLSWFLGALWKRGGWGAAAAPLLVLATVGVQWIQFVPPASQHGVTRTRDAALEQARAAQNAARAAGVPSTILFRSDDALWGFWYVKFALNAAPEVATPWGRLVFDRTLGPEVNRYVAQLKRNGPVFINGWDDATDQRFPLMMATPSGNLVLASDRRLPAPARPLLANSTDFLRATPGPNGLRRARFRRVSLWKRGESATLPNIAIGSMAAFDTDFRAPQRPAQTAPGDWQAALIEVLIAPAKTFGKSVPLPTQSVSANEEFSVERVSITRQHRRLILPPNARAGALYRMSVPISTDYRSVVGRYRIWTRIVPNTQNTTTPWTLSDEVFLTHR